MIEASGKKSAERLLEAWIAELESHRTVDPGRLKLSELLDRWLEATRVAIAHQDAMSRTTLTPATSFP